ncbi:MAG: hypothetical protein FWG03_07590 [Clostridiales bacterium]|nr:hypothetical protein [Clostridiales bacterium]
MENTDGVSIDNSFLQEHFAPRPRVDGILDRAAGGRLFYVVAGAGYGKTQTVYNYVKRQEDAVVRWVQLTDSDNVSSHFWLNLSRNIAFDNPDLAVKLREAGFPDTLMKFRQFSEILRTTEHRSHKMFLVMDDFHIIHSKQTLTFVERCANLGIPGSCVVIVSRKEPPINAASLFSKGQASIITEEDLCFTADEISDFLRQSGVSFSAKDLPLFVDATKGWALAVNLLGIVLKRKPETLGRALEIMKQNVFNLIQTEAFDDFKESVKKTVVGLSLVSGLPFAFSREIADFSSLLENTPQLASFLWFDSYSESLRIHPLYLEFLQSRQEILSAKEKDDIYRRAAEWCSENDFYTGAVNYYAQLRQFGLVLKALLSYPFKLPPDSCEYYLNILENLEPSEEECSGESYLILRNLFMPLLLAGAGRYEEARAFSEAAIEEWRDSDQPFSKNILYTAYSNLAYIDTYTCTVTHRYDSSVFLKKALEYRKMTTIPTLGASGSFAVADVRSYACLVGEGADIEEFDLFLETTRETVAYSLAIDHDIYYGFDDLVACEIAYYKNQLDAARGLAHSAIAKAREKSQWSIEAMAEQYLLFIALC